MIKQYETINTFTRAPVPAQIATYLIFLGQAITFFICIFINYRNNTKQIAIVILYLSTMIAQLVITIKTSCTDPSDNIMIEYRNGKNRYQFLFLFLEKMSQLTIVCIVTFAQAMQNKLRGIAKYAKGTHKSYSRCVQQFDHHCMWINNCVGSKNYQGFLAMIIITFLNMVVYIISMVLLWIEGAWMQYLGSMIAAWVFSFIIGVFCLLLVNLIGLHIYLIYRGITTYQFIMLQREEEKKRQQQQKAKQIQMQALRQNTINPVTTKNVQGQSKLFDEQRPSISVNKGEFKNQSQFRSHQNSDVIFNEQQNKTEKSQNMSFKENESNKHRNIKITLQERQENQNQEPSPLSSKKQSQSNLSNFFTKNKSLKFFIGDQIGSRPKSSRNHKQRSKQNLFKSVRVINQNELKNKFYKSQANKVNQIATQQIKIVKNLKTLNQESSSKKSFNQIGSKKNMY